MMATIGATMIYGTMHNCRSTINRSADMIATNFPDSVSTKLFSDKFKILSNILATSVLLKNTETSIPP